MRVDLSPAHVGSRVVARRALRSGGWSDVLGELVEWRDGDVLVIRTKRGELVEVALATVVAGKPVPPRVPTAAEILSVEAAAAPGWPGLEQDRLGGWLLRAGGGFTGRANSVLPLGDPGLDLPDALAAVAAWYAERGLPPRFQIPLRARSVLDRELEAAGFVVDTPSHVLVAELGDVLRPGAGSGGPATASRESGGTAVDSAEPAEGPPRLTIAPSADEAWLAAYNYRGGSLPAVGRAVLAACGGELRFASIRDADGVVAIGRGAVAEGWLGLTAVEVAPRARRRGHAASLCRALAAWAYELGARRAYLQVADTNTAALELYSRLGFRRHHRYHYRKVAG